MTSLNPMLAIQSHYWAVRDYLAPVLKESKFKEHGRITPEEFVAAGEFLTYKFPVWTWEQGDASKIRDFLPPTKQYLLTRNVPCLRRAGTLNYTDADEDAERMISILDEAEEAPAQGSSPKKGKKKLSGESDDDWVETHTGRQAQTQHNATDLASMDIPDLDDVHLSSHQSTATLDGAPDLSALSVQDTAADDNESVPLNMDDIPDMDDDLDGFEGGVQEEEDDAVVSTIPSVVGKGVEVDGKVQEGNLLSVRTYDVMITYDKYYQTPRVWLLGYDENKTPLTPNQTFEDIPSDHAFKTVTMENFPHFGGAQQSLASIHPCKHASVMKKVIERMGEKAAQEQRRALSSSSSLEPTPAGGAVKEQTSKRKWLGGAIRKVTGGGEKEEKTQEGDGEGGLEVDFYLVIFLKFIASIVPTIEVDSTTAF